MRPFYLNIGTIETHAVTWQSNTALDRLTTRYKPGPPEQTSVPPFLPDVPPIRKEMAQFRACIRYLDTQIQPLFEAIERLGFKNDTLVIFTTDHGISGERAKGTLYDHGTEIALLVQGPGIAPSGQTQALLTNIDYCPTLLEAAGAPIPPMIQGRSFWPLLVGGAYLPHDAVVTERHYHGGNAGPQPPPGAIVPPGASHTDYDPMRSVRTPRFHYIRNLGEIRFINGCPAKRPRSTKRLPAGTTNSGPPKPGRVPGKSCSIPSPTRTKRATSPMTRCLKAFKPTFPPVWISG